MNYYESNSRMTRNKQNQMLYSPMMTTSLCTVSLGRKILWFVSFILMAVFSSFFFVNVVRWSSIDRCDSYSSTTQVWRRCSLCFTIVAFSLPHTLKRMTDVLIWISRKSVYVIKLIHYCRFIRIAANSLVVYTYYYIWSQRFQFCAEKIEIKNKLRRFISIECKM